MVKRMKKNVFAGVFVLLLCLTCVSQAEWKSISSKTGNWDTVVWDTPGPAGAGDHAALIDSHLDITNSKTLDNLSVGFAVDGSLDVLAPSGSVSVVFSLMVGHAGGVGTLNLYGPAFGGWVRVGNNEAGARGIVNVYSGGTLSSGNVGDFGIGNDTGYGYVYLKGTGNMDVTALSLAIYDTGHLDIEAGKLRVAGDATSLLTNYITNGKITGYGIVGNLNTPVLGTGADAGWTVLTAVPEPATMILLGLGSLLLRKRKA